MSDLSADLQRPGGIGLLWGITREGLTASLIGWGPGQGLEEHSDDERDVLMIAIEGSGTVVVDGREHPLVTDRAVVIEKGARREITAGADGLRYLSVRHRPRPSPLEPVSAADDRRVAAAQ